MNYSEIKQLTKAFDSGPHNNAPSIEDDIVSGQIKVGKVNSALSSRTNGFQIILKPVKNCTLSRTYLICYQKSSTRTENTVQSDKYLRQDQPNFNNGKKAPRNTSYDTQTDKLSFQNFRCLQNSFSTIYQQRTLPSESSEKYEIDSNIFKSHRIEESLNRKVPRTNKENRVVFDESS